MDSAHCDERNLAHSAIGRNVKNKVDNSVVEIAKLKEDHDKQIQKLTFENRIKILELEKEMSRQDNEQKMKILQLEKDNQSLSHEFEFMKLKTSQEMEGKKVVVDREMEKEMLKQQKEFQNRLSEKDKALLEKDKALLEKDNEITAKENECKTKINEMEKSLLVKEYEYQTKMAAKENEFLEMEKEKELVIQSLRHKIEMLEASKIKELHKEFKPEVLPSSESEDGPENLKQTSNSIVTTEDKILWGVKKYFLIIKTESNLFTSYENWYEALSSLLENKVQKFVKQGGRRYYFIRKEMLDYDPTLYLVTKRKHAVKITGSNFLIVEYPNREELKNARSFLLHPEQRDECIQITTFDCYVKDCEHWVVYDVSRNYYFGEKKSVIVFFYL
ncbi:DNA ligase 1-like [Clytia hemisphaerica]|uniref:DNA ligase 1-like n=1 Tax=Clytia hemisphaerica TaxID=252671 RepID=UPI0034D3D75F